MNTLLLMPGPGPRGDRDGNDVMHVLGAVFVSALVALAFAAVIMLLWNSFKVRSEVRALRGEVAQLHPGSADVDPTIAPAIGSTPPPAPADGLAVPPAATVKAPRIKPKDTTDTVE